MSHARTTVLVVEDERIIARDLAQTLDEMGYDVMGIASSSEETVAAATTRCPDVVVMDIRIEGELDGIATAEILRSRFDVPVIFLTAHADHATLARAKVTAPYGYLVKPVKPVELRGMIEVALHRHGIERQLRERERWFSTTLRSIADAVIAVDLAGNVAFMNPTAEALTGKTEKAAHGLPLGHTFRLEGGGEIAADRALRDRKRVDLVEGRVRNAEGSLRHVTESAAPVMDREEPLGAVLVVRDITERRELENQLERSERLASLGTMAAGVAHEVNNPLAIVSANTDYLEQQLVEVEERLRSDPATRSAAESLQEIPAVFKDVRTAVDRISRIVSDLRIFSRPRPTDSDAVNVPRSVEWAVRATAHELRHRAKVVVDLEEVPVARGEESRLVQVLINLLMNAAQAIDPGGSERNLVTIRVHRLATDDIGIEVTDTGAGMDASTAEHAFEPFFTTKEHGAGTGLGLSICHGIVKSFGGDITVESALGRGTTFRIQLRPAAGVVASALDAPPPDVHVSHRRSKVRGRIFVVDDDPEILSALERTLREHEVVTFSDPHLALEAIERGDPFDVLLCDVMMPTMTGMEFFEKVRAHDANLTTRVIFLSAGVIGTPLEAFVREVGGDYVEKPFRPDELHSRIRDKLALLSSRSRWEERSS